MNELEAQYRLLLRAYPSDHRARNEDEIISTLLDVAADGQRRPKLREAAAIVTAGLGCRAEKSSELRPGLRIAGVGALFAVVAISSMSSVLAITRPFDLGLMPALAWLAVIAMSVVGARSTSAYRFVPAAVMSLAMIATGASAMGLRRSTVVPVAIFLVLSVLSQPTRRAARSAAVAAGVCFGLAYGLIVAADLRRLFQNSDSSWVYVAQWDITSDLMSVHSPMLFNLCLLVAIVAFLLRRPRYAIAAIILCGPLAPGALVGGRGLIPYAGTAADLALLATVGAALIVGASVGVPWMSHRKTHRGGSGF